MMRRSTMPAWSTWMWMRNPHFWAGKSAPPPPPQYASQENRQWIALGAGGGDDSMLCRIRRGCTLSLWGALLALPRGFERQHRSHRNAKRDQVANHGSDGRR